MIVHVLPGDSLAGDFAKTGIEGGVIVCRECLIVGDVSGETLDEFWQRRANFIMVDYGGDEIDYYENVAGELTKLIDLPDGTEVNLWFEYELFCNANMWFCLDLLRTSDTEIYRVEPIVRDDKSIWKGFGGLTPEELRTCFYARKKFSSNDIQLGIDLWNAYKNSDEAKLKDLAQSNSPCFPYLREVCEAAIDKETRPKEILREIKDTGIADFDRIFPEFVKRAGMYGFGDVQVGQMLARMGNEVTDEI